MDTSVVTTKGQVVIPVKIRKKFNIKKGSRLYFEERGEDLIIKALTPRYFNKIAGILNTKGRLSKALIMERSKDKEREA